MENYPNPFTADEMLEGMSSNYAGQDDDMVDDFEGQAFSGFVGQEKSDKIFSFKIEGTNTTAVKTALFPGNYPTERTPAGAIDGEIVFNAVRSGIKELGYKAVVAESGGTELGFWQSGLTYLKVIEQSHDIEFMRRWICNNPREIVKIRISANAQSLLPNSGTLDIYNPAEKSNPIIQLRSLVNVNTNGFNLNEFEVPATFFLSDSSVFGFTIPATPASLAGAPSVITISYFLGAGISNASALKKKKSKAVAKKPAVKKK